MDEIKRFFILFLKATNSLFVLYLVCRHNIKVFFFDHLGHTTAAVATLALVDRGWWALALGAEGQVE
jgi:hypothetical protein